VRSKFVLYVGCAIFTLYLIGWVLLLLFRASDDPFGLVMTTARLPGMGGTTTTNLIFAATAIGLTIAIIAVAVVRVRQLLKQTHQDTPPKASDESRFLLHTHIEHLRSIAESRRRHWRRSK
jgi:hypothetical protein